MLDFHHIFYFSSFACKVYIHLCDHHCSEGSNRYPGQFFSETSSDIAQDKGDRHSLNPSYLILSTFKSILTYILVSNTFKYFKRSLAIFWGREAVFKIKVEAH